MKKFLDEDFLLETETAKKLYHDYAKNMPVFDYHCHLSAKEIAENKKFQNLTEIWLDGDHYKWRLMRSNGVSEQYVTGNASDKDKFDRWAETVPYTIGNPLFHWTHLELQRYFGISDMLNSKTKDAVWEKCNDMLQTKEFTARELIRRSNVKALCTTDDPSDTLEYHKMLRDDTSFDVKVMPAFRPDGALNIEKETFMDWVGNLGRVSGLQIETYQDFLQCLQKRIAYFHEAGCRLSDHGIETRFYMEADEEDVTAIFDKRLARERLTEEEATKFKSAVFLYLGQQYHAYGWAMQLHIGGLRSTNSRMLQAVGPNTGFDSIADFVYAQELSGFLDALDRTGSLPKTILYCLNPRDNYMLATMAGNFQGGIPGKIQFGSAWWFNDQRDGMEDQIKTLANVGLLSRFVGMLTDSRSFLSYTRHEYFRRILCNMIGKWVENGEYPADFDILGEIVRDISYNNIKNYLAAE